MPARTQSGCTLLHAMLEDHVLLKPLRPFSGFAGDLCFFKGRAYEGHLADLRFNPFMFPIPHQTNIKRGQAKEVWNHTAHHPSQLQVTGSQHPPSRQKSKTRGTRVDHVAKEYQVGWSIRKSCPRQLDGFRPAYVNNQYCNSRAIS